MSLKLLGSDILRQAEMGDMEARCLLAIALQVFEDYVQAVDSKRFAERWGEYGTEALAKYSTSG